MVEQFQTLYSANIDRFITALFWAILIAACVSLIDLIMSDVKAHEKRQKSYKLK